MLDIPIYQLTLTILPLPCFYYIYKRHIQRKRCSLLDYSIYGMKMFFLFFADSGLTLLYNAQPGGHLLDYILIIWSSIGFIMNLNTYIIIKKIK